MNALLLSIIFVIFSIFLFFAYSFPTFLFSAYSFLPDVTVFFFFGVLYNDAKVPIFSDVVGYFYFFYSRTTFFGFCFRLCSKHRS